jgi:hypothetical protein
LQGTCSPAFVSMLPLCAPSQRASPTLPVGSHADWVVWAASSTWRRPGSRLDVADRRRKHALVERPAELDPVKGELHLLLGRAPPSLRAGVCP